MNKQTLQTISRHLKGIVAAIDKTVEDTTHIEPEWSAYFSKSPSNYTEKELRDSIDRLSKTPQLSPIMMEAAINGINILVDEAKKRGIKLK